MKIAWLTTPPSIPSQVGDYAHALLPALRRHCEVELFVAHDRAGVASDGSVLRSVLELSPREFDHIVYQVGDEEHHAFMLPIVRAFGGTVVLHDWSLFELTRAAHPALARGGASGLRVVLREGGIRVARNYFADRERWLRGDAAVARPALNRSIVRSGDAFIVHTSELKQRILLDRNAHTPIANLRPLSDPSVLAAEYASFLETCPAPRAKKKSLIRSMIEASERRRAEDARSRSEDDSVAGGHRENDSRTDAFDMSARRG